MTDSKQAALSQSIALATRRELDQDFNNLSIMLRGLAADLERSRAELRELCDLLKVKQLKTAEASQKRAVAKTRAQQRAPPPLEVEDGATDPAAAVAAAPPIPSNAMLYLIRLLVDDVEGARASLLEDLPAAETVRALAETASTKNDRAKLSALADKWTGNGSELFPADWRALGRSAWKTLAPEKQDAIRVAFRAARAGSA